MECWAPYPRYVSLVSPLSFQNSEEVQDLFLDLSPAVGEDGEVKMLLVSVWDSDCCVIPNGAHKPVLLFVQV